VEQADVNALIGDLVKVTDPSWQSKSVHIALALEPSLPRLACDRDKLKQIVLNLLLNALEATPQGGTVRLETSSLVNHRQERFVEILVADAGPGIPPELAGRVFSPVESAKGEGHAGLGLSIVKALTQSLNGSITFKSHATGTTFQISLPVG
jgi:signal transduction histidine kinase